MSADLFSVPGYLVEERRHARAILEADYPEVAEELGEALSHLAIDPQHVIEGGGGKSRMTQSLEASLKNRGWLKKNFSIKQTIDEIEIDSRTHEIDHFRGFQGDRPGIALEIEWNNKDPFFDRDLETFARLHRLGVISIGILITRGPTMKIALRRIFEDYCSDLPSENLKALAERLKSGERFGKAQPSLRPGIIAGALFASKYGEATTHWKKLFDRLDRGLGDPCPLLLVGIEEGRLIPSTVP